MLFYQRPGLSLLLSMEAPTVCSGRIFSYDSPFSTLRVDVEDRPLLRQVSSTKPFRQMFIILFEYVFAFGAIYNIVYLSIDLGWRSGMPYQLDTPGLGAIPWNYLSYWSRGISHNS